jgi:translin
MTMANKKRMEDITEEIRSRFEALNDAREKALKQSRDLTRQCSECIRAIHRREWDDVETRLTDISASADALKAAVADYPELYHSGYTQDALKEVVEAYCTYAIIREEPLPTLDELDVEASTYLKGLGEAATELRRFILDIMRRNIEHSDESERLLEWMDAVYGRLITFDFPDALTHGLRRQTDIVRSVLERTRGDLTNSLRQQRLQDALAQFEAHLDDNAE